MSPSRFLTANPCTQCSKKTLRSTLLPSTAAAAELACTSPKEPIVSCTALSLRVSVITSPSAGNSSRSSRTRGSIRLAPSPQWAATTSASEIPRFAARSRSRIFGLSRRARLISCGAGLTRWSIIPLPRSLLVEDELALAGDLQAIQGAVMLNADLVLALEQGIGRQGTHRKRKPLDPYRRRLPPARLVAETVRVMPVHGVCSRCFTA